MSKENEQAGGGLTVIFADICGSTTLYEKVGDEAALDLISRTFRLLENLIEKHRGRVIRTLGDEVLCCFEEASDAARAAGEMHLAVKADPVIGPAGVGLRLGINTGPAIFKDGDIYGDAVNVAARAVGLAKRDQIIVTQALLDALPTDGRPRFRRLGRLAVKGKGEELDFHELLWEEGPELTRAETFNRSGVERKREGILRLFFREEVFQVGGNRALLYLGRSEENNMVVPRHFVSRRHATIEFRNGAFMLSDHSANGLFLRPPGGKSLFVHRDQVSLFGQGEISLGRDFSKEEAEVIRFSVEL